MNRRSIVLEVASQGGGTYTLMRVSEDASYREGAGARLVLTLREIDGRRAARIGAAIGAGLGALCAGGLAVALLPEHGAPDGLTPTRGDFWPEALAIGGVLGGLICGFVARMIGEPVRRALSRRGTIPPPSRMTAVFGEHVVVDGVDTGRLRMHRLWIPSVTNLVGVAHELRVSAAPRAGARPPLPAPEW